MIMDIKKILKKIKTGNMLVGIILIVAGIITMLFPKNSLISVCSIMGYICIASGILLCLFSRRITKGGAASIIAGFVFLLHPKFIVSVLPFIIGLVLIIKSGVSLIRAYRKKNGKFIYVLPPLLLLISGLLITANPFRSASLVIVFIGLGLVILGVNIVISAARLQKNVEIIEPDDGFKEVEFHDVDD